MAKSPRQKEREAWDKVADAAMSLYNQSEARITEVHYFDNKSPEVKKIIKQIKNVGEKPGTKLISATIICRWLINGEEGERTSCKLK